MKNIIKAVVAGISVSTAYFVSQVKIIRKTQYHISNKKLPKSFEGFKIIQISDLHDTHFGKNNKILINKIKHSNPDLVVVTGDSVKHKKDVDYTVKTLSEINTICPVLWVSGNHEFICHSYDMMVEELKKNNILVLDKQKSYITINNETIVVTGVADPQIYNKKERRKNFNNDLKNAEDDPRKFTILLSHQPQYLKDYEYHHFDLVFSGHAHGGQWRFFNRGLYAPGQGVFPSLTAGVHKMGKTKMVISRGLGWTNCCLRINNPAELVEVILHKS